MGVRGELFGVPLWCPRPFGRIGAKPQAAGWPEWLGGPKFLERFVGYQFCRLDCFGFWGCVYFP